MLRYKDSNISESLPGPYMLCTVEGLLFNTEALYSASYPIRIWQKAVLSWIEAPPPFCISHGKCRTFINGKQTNEYVYVCKHSRTCRLRKTISDAVWNRVQLLSPHQIQFSTVFFSPYIIIIIIKKDFYSLINDTLHFCPFLVTLNVVHHLPACLTYLQ